MSLQWVARVGVRQLRLADGLGRPGRVIGIENQLRQLTLSTRSRQLSPPLSALSSVASQQSRLFSTQDDDLSASTTKTPPRPKRKTKSNKPRKTQKKKPAPPKKKVLTEKQKEAEERKKERDHIKALKETALQPPKALSERPFNIAFPAVYARVKQTTPDHKEAFTKTVHQVKEIPQHEYEQLKIQAEANRVANEAAYEAWLKTFTPIQIKDANSARRTLTRLLIKPRLYPLKDDRLVKRPWNAFMHFSTGRRESGDFMHLPQKDTSARLGQEWKNMTEREKEPYKKLAEQDYERYTREYLEVYGEHPISVKVSMSKSNSPA